MAGLYSPYGGKSKRAFYEGQFGYLKTERASFDSHWAELGAWLLPRRTRFQATDRNRGDKRNQNIIDSTARFAARTLASGLHAGLTSPARPWFKLSTPDPDLLKIDSVKNWLYLVTLRMQNIFAETNLYNALPIVYGDMGTFGTAAMSILSDSKDLFRAKTYPIGSYVFGMSSRDTLATFMLEYELTVEQVVATFGGEHGQNAIPGMEIDWSGISSSTQKNWDAGNYHSPVSCLWVVTPNPARDASKLGAKYMPFTSCHFERGGEGADGAKVLREAGFKTFPVMGPRWDVTGDDSYGTDCPGMTALGDVKQLQGMQREKGKAIAKMINPPLQAPSSLRQQKTSLLPGDLTYVDVRDGMQGLRSVHDVTLNIEHLRGDIGETGYRIQRAFYEDLFLMLSNSDPNRGDQPITAREVDERHEEKLLALGPVLERTNDELLDPLIERTYALMADAGLIPDIPDELDGVNMKVEYISILAQAQKLVGVTGQDRLIQTVIGMAEVFPDVRNKVDVNQLIDNYGEMLGVDPRVIVPSDQAKAATDQQNQAAAAQQAAQTSAVSAKAARDASQAPLDGNTALSAIVGNAANPGGTGAAA